MQTDVLAFGFSLLEETPALTRKAMTLTPDQDQGRVLAARPCPEPGPQGVGAQSAQGWGAG